MMRKNFSILVLTFLVFTIISKSGFAQPAAVSLPVMESFDASGFPSGWTQQHSGGVSVNNWSIANDNLAGGQPNEAFGSWLFAVGTSRLVSPPILTDGVDGIIVTFRHFMADYFFGLEFKIQSSSNGTDWVDENWSAISGFGNLGPEHVTTTISHAFGDTTYIAFTMEGDHYEFWGWSIDDIQIEELSTSPSCAEAIFPDDLTDSVPVNLELVWDVAPGASDYLLFLGTDNPPTNVFNGISTASKAHMPVFNLLPGTVYYWKVVPQNVYGQPDGCPVCTFGTREPFTLPFTEDFSSTDIPAGWIEVDSAVTKGWYIYQGNYAGGMPNELEFDFKAAVGLSRIISPPIQTSGETMLTLRFKTIFGDDIPGMYIKVQTSQDAIHWTDEVWQYASGSGSFGPEEIEVPVYNNLGGMLYFAFVLEGDLYTFNYWAIDDISLESGGEFPSSVSGIVSYAKTPEVPMGNITVYLTTQDGTPVDTTVTDASGNYTFENLLPGQYVLNFATNHGWGGGNAVDALLSMKHFTGLTPLSGIRLKAADVNNSGNVNSVDALLIMKRFVGLETSFPSGDWCFTHQIINLLPDENKIIPVQALCFGDVDASLIP